MKSHIDTSGKILVMGYRRGNGTRVKPYWRRLPSRQIGARRNIQDNPGQLTLFDQNQPSSSN